MLVLNRKEKEQILIGKDIVVTVTRVIGKRVQLAIHAPPDVRIMRSELRPSGETPAQTLPADGVLQLG